MKYSVLMQSGSQRNFEIAAESFWGDGEMDRLLVCSTFPMVSSELCSWWPQEHPWNPARIWNHLRRVADPRFPVVLISDDVRVHGDGLRRLASLAQESGAAIHASIIGNVINLPILNSPYRAAVAEVVPVIRGTQLPLICCALPTGWATEFDEGYVGYGRDDHDFWEASIRAGRKVYVTRSVIVAHDDESLGTGRSVGRKPGGWVFDREQVKKNEARFFAKWGY